MNGKRTEMHWIHWVLATRASAIGTSAIGASATESLTIEAPSRGLLATFLVNYVRKGKERKGRRTRENKKNEKIRKEIENNENNY